MTHDAECSNLKKQDERNIYEILKTMCPPGYHHNSCIWAHNVALHIACTNEPKSPQKAKKECNISDYK